jgi:CubicO group peptidase (beta-lactamase class C family)
MPRWSPPQATFRNGPKKEPMNDGRLRRFLGIVAFACGITGASCSTIGATPLGPVRDARIDAAVRFVMDDPKIAGLALGIARASHIVAIRTYGYADRASRRRVDARTVFPIGSLTKSFTAAMLRMLVLEGRVAPDAALRRYVPEYRAAGAVTIDELLAQTGGIPDYAQGVGFLASSALPLAPESLIARAAAQPLGPSGTFEYANTNYLLAAVIAQRAAGVSYAALLRRSILDPLRLERTAVANAFAAPVDRARGDASEGSATLGFGCADLESDVPDLLAWSGALFAGRVVPAPRAIGPYDDGFFLATTLGRRVAYASGYVPGFSSYLLVVPDADLRVVLLSNAGNVDLGPLARSVAAAALDLRETD